jgi:L-cystine transport system substrate-binding protein
MKFSALRRVTLLATLGLAFAAGIASPAFAAEDLLKQVKQRGLNVGLEGTYPPFSFQDEKGELTGFEVDFANALGKQLGVKVNLTPTKWDGMLAALESKRLDVVINQVTISDERKKKYDFSAPYTVSGIQALTKKALASQITKPSDLAGKKVGVGLGSNYEQWLKTNVPQAEVKTYDDDPTKYQDLRVGRTDAILVDRFAALDLIKQTGDTLALAGAPFAREESGIALRKGNEDLLNAINQAIEALRKNGTLASISQKWFKLDVTK